MPYKDDETRKTKQAEYGRRWYERNKERRLAHNAAWRQKRVEWLAEYKVDTRCSVCGYNRCSAALDFHHIDPDKKEFSIANGIRLYGKDKINAEIAKCIILCRNCHAEHHSLLP